MTDLTDVLCRIDCNLRTAAHYDPDPYARAVRFAIAALQMDGKLSQHLQQALSQRSSRSQWRLLRPYLSEAALLSLDAKLIHFVDPHNHTI